MAKQVAKKAVIRRRREKKNIDARRRPYPVQLQ